MKPFQFHIGTLMKVILLVAAIAAASRIVAPPDAWLFYLSLAYTALVLVLMPVLTVAPWLRVEQLKKNPNPDSNSQRKALLSVATSHWNLNAGSRILARSLLAELEKREKNFEAAAAHYGAILTNRVPHGLEAKLRLDLAYCLERLCRADEANNQRALADECLDNQPTDVWGWLSQGKLFDREHRYVEACQAFEQALAHLPPRLGEFRPQVLIQLALSSYHAGQVNETVKWCEACLGENAEGLYRTLAHQMAGLAYGDLGQLDLAERHHQAAYDIAVESGDPKAASECLAQLADIQCKRGKLVEAEQACLQAAALGAPANRAALVTRAEILRLWGRFDESIDSLLQAGRAQPHNTPTHEVRYQAVLNLGIAKTAAELGDADRVRIHLDKATEAFVGDAKLTLYCQTTAAWLAAIEGDAEESARLEAEALAALPAFDRNRTTYLGTLASLGRAALSRGDFAQSESLFLHYRDCGPDPVSEANVLYYLGQCRWQQADHAGARALFEQADATGLDTHCARLAREMLHGAPDITS